MSASLDRSIGTRTTCRHVIGGRGRGRRRMGRGASGGDTPACGHAHDHPPLVPLHHFDPPNEWRHVERTITPCEEKRVSVKIYIRVLLGLPIILLVPLANVYILLSYYSSLSEYLSISLHCTYSNLLR